MLSQTEAHRLAASINALRADWPLASLSTFIRTKLADRAYRDAAVALAWVATDERTTTPARVLEAGPWWRAAQAGDPTLSTITHRCPEHPAEAAWNCAPCDAEKVTPERAHELAAAARAALTRTVTHHHPQPAVTDPSAARAAIDNAKEA